LTFSEVSEKIKCRSENNYQNNYVACSNIIMNNAVKSLNILAINLSVLIIVVKFIFKFVFS